MNKLQHLLDTAFGKPAADRTPQEPNAFTVQRQIVFEETAQKIERLRRARLERAAPTH